LKELRDYCAKIEHKAKPFKMWQPGDPPSQPLHPTKGHGNHNHCSWKVQGLPANDEIMKDGIVLWEQKYVRLTDEAAIYALLLFPWTYRRDYLAADFDSCGESRKSRVPIHPTIEANQNNIVCALVYRGWYIFTGGNNQARWLFTKPVTNGVKVLIASLVILLLRYKTPRYITLQSYSSNIVPDPVFFYLFLTYFREP
jgi:hypothetical protein